MYVCLFFTLAILFWVLTALRFGAVEPRRLRRWAQLNGLVLLHHERRAWWQQPFRAADPDCNSVFLVTVMDRAGHRRQAFVMLGGRVSILGMPIGAVQVQWVEEAAAPGLASGPPPVLPRVPPKRK